MELPIERNARLIHLKGQLDGLVSLEDRQFFHLKTVSNLIYHYSEVQREVDKEWVYESLLVFLEDAMNYVGGIDRNTSQYLYKEHLTKVTSFYAQNLRFTFYVPTWLIVCLYTGLFLLSLLFFKALIGLFAIGFLCSIHLSFFRFKHKQKRAFGIYY